MNISDFIKMKRYKLCLSRYEIENETGISFISVLNLEQHKTAPMFRTIKIICDYYNWEIKFGEYNDFSDFIFYNRTKHNITQGQLGKKLGLCYQSICRIELKKVLPSFNVVIKACEYFGCKLTIDGYEIN